MPTRYSYQTMLAGSPGSVLTLEGDRATGTNVTSFVPATPEQVRQSINEIRAWFRKIRELERFEDGVADMPWESWVRTMGNSGKVEMSYTAGTLIRKATYDGKAGTIQSSPAVAFDVSVWSWLRMHDAYLALCAVAEASAKAAK